MTKQTQNIIFRTAKAADTPAILQFIHDHWDADHVFVKWPELFLYCHKFNENDISFAIAEDLSERKMYGLCGYIPSNGTPNPDIWVALWKVIPSGSPTMGIELLEFVRKTTNCKVFSCNGIAKKVLPIYKYLGYTTGKLHHHYILADLPAYRVAKLIDRAAPANDIEKPLQAKLIEIDSLEHISDALLLELLESHKPYKDLRYIKKRYVNHIAYQYKLFLMKTKQDPANLLLIAREIECNGVKILRIIDVIGNPDGLLFLRTAFKKLLRESGYEYIDIYQWGIAEEILQKAGFVERKENDENIIPNYFEPFEQKNVDIYFFTNDTDNFYMFKGDGDQDRPNTAALKGD